MQAFTEHQLLGAFFAIAIVLLITRGMAELCRRVGQPEVLGELLGGFLIGPSIFGALFPGAFHALFLNPAISLALTLLSWIGAILLLMIAGMEADLAILRQKAVPGMLAAAGAIGASVGAGAFLGEHFFHLEPVRAFFLGLVLSVTAVSVVAKLLIEREALRRDYAQVMLAAGIAGEVLVWPLISILSSLQHKANPFLAGARASILAVLFFVFMFTVGRWFLFWAMRRVADASSIPNGELSLVLLLLCVAAASTTVLGLHPLLGAFVFGVLLGKAPRATLELKERIQAITIAFFAPIFFGLAGMRVNLFQLRGASSIEAILLLLFVAGAVKIVFGYLGATAGRLPFWEAGAVGVGLNLKGGTDVVVAIVGTELLLMSEDLYTAYAVVAILTVIACPPLMNWLASRSRPGSAELQRLNREEARRLAYLADRERVLLPLIPELQPAMPAQLLAAIASAKHAEGELFDVTELSLTKEQSIVGAGLDPGVAQASSLLSHAVDTSGLKLERLSLPDQEAFTAVQSAAEGQHLVVLGAELNSSRETLSFGPMQDQILRELSTDVLIALRPAEEAGQVRRILVPINGLGPSLAAADVAGYIAKGCGAEVTVFAVVTPRLGPMFWRERKHRDLLQAGYTTTREATRRIERLQIQTSENVVLHEAPAQAILAELDRQPYDLLVLGGVMRSSEDGISLGRTIEHLVQAAKLPSVILVSRAVEA